MGSYGRSAEFGAEVCARRDDLQRAISEAFPEFERVTVEFGTRPLVTLGGDEGRFYAFVVKLYEVAGAPVASFDFALEAPDLEISAAVSKYLEGRPVG